MKRLGMIFLSTLIALTSFVWNGEGSTIVHANEKTIEIEVENANFELVNEDNTFPGWTTRITGDEDGLLTEAVPETDPQFVKTGSQSLKLEDRSPKKGIEFVSDRIEVEGGQTYRLTTDVYAAEKSVRIYLKYYDEFGRPAGEGNVLSNIPNVWHTEVFEVYAPENAKTVEIWFYKGGPGTDTLVYIDSVKLEQLVVEEVVIPYEGESIDLGSMVNIALSQAATFGEEDGRLVQYVTTQGTPVYFVVADALTGEIISQFPVPGSGASDTVWGIDKGSDGNVYFTSKGRLIRYNTGSKEIEILGQNPTGNTTMYDVKASSDGKIYGSTHNSTGLGKVFEYDIETNEFRTLEKLVFEGQKFARGLGVTDEYVYVGYGEEAHLLRYDRNTEEIIEINIPGLTGQPRTLSEIEVFGDTLFVYAGPDVYVMSKDGDNYEYVDSFKFQKKIEAEQVEQPSVFYYKDGEEFYQYDLNLKQSTKIISAETPLPDTEFKAVEWLTPTTGKYAGKNVLFGMAAYGETMIFDPSDHSFTLHHVDLPLVGTSINALKHKDGLLFMGGYQRGASVYDTSKNEIIYNFPSFHQPEGIGFLGDSIYFGAYPGAKIYRLNLNEAIDFNQFGWGNPGIASIVEGQNRPFVMTEGDGKLFVGTFNVGSNFQGALSIIEEKKDTSGRVVGTEEETFYDVAKDQSIIGLAYADGMLFGSTTIYSGSASLSPYPIQEKATVFKFDPVTKEVVATVSPEVDGLTGTPHIIGELSVGPDGLIWGVMAANKGSEPNVPSGYDGAIFALNPETLEVEKSKIITTVARTVSKLRPFYIEWGPDGNIYTTLGEKIMMIDPNTLTSVDVLPGEKVSVFTIANNGDLYYAKDTKLFKLKSTLEIPVEPENPEEPGTKPTNPGGGGYPPAVDQTQRKLNASDWIADHGQVTIRLAEETNKLLIPISIIDDAANEVLVVIQGELQLEIPLAFAGNFDASSVLSIQLNLLDDEARTELISESNYTDDGFGFTLQLLVDDEEITLGEEAAVELLVNRDGTVLYYINDEDQIVFVGGKTKETANTATVSHLGTFLSLQYEMPFADVSQEHWANDAIKYLAARQIVNGMSQTEFGTEQSLTRAQFTTLLVRLFDLQNAGDYSAFSDVKSSDWYANDIQIAASLGIVNGMSATEFKPDVHITREQMAVMLVRAYEKTTGQAIDGSISSEFEDTIQMSDWALDAIEAAVSQGWMQGNPDHTFAPKSEATRAESATLLYNFLNQ